MGTPSQNESTGRSNNRWDQKRAGLSALVAALSEVASLRHVQAAAFLERVRRADFDSASKVEQTPTCSTRGNNVRNEIDEARALLLRCEEPDSCQFVVNELLKDLREPSAITRVRKAFEILFEESKCQGVEVDSAVAELFTKVQTRRSSDLMCILRGLISSVAPDKLERIVSTSYNNPFFSDLFPVAKDFLAVAARPGFQTKDSNDRNEGWLLLQKCSEQEKAFILTRIFTVVQSSTFDTDFASLSAISTIVLHQSSLAVTHAAVNRILDTLELRDRAGTLMERVSADRHRSSSTTDAYESPDMRERRGYWRQCARQRMGLATFYFETLAAARIVDVPFARKTAEALRTHFDKELGSVQPTYLSALGSAVRVLPPAEQLPYLTLVSEHCVLRDFPVWQEIRASAPSAIATIEVPAEIRPREALKALREHLQSHDELLRNAAFARLKVVLDAQPESTWVRSGESVGILMIDEAEDRTAVSIGAGTYDLMAAGAVHDYLTDRIVKAKTPAVRARHVRELLKVDLDLLETDIRRRLQIPPLAKALDFICATALPASEQELREECIGRIRSKIESIERYGVEVDRAEVIPTLKVALLRLLPGARPELQDSALQAIRGGDTDPETLLERLPDRERGEVRNVPVWLRRNAIKMRKHSSPIWRMRR